jgi:hypothetical protein
MKTPLVAPYAMPSTVTTPRFAPVRLSKQGLVPANDIVAVDPLPTATPCERRSLG